MINTKINTAPDRIQNSNLRPNLVGPTTAYLDIDFFARIPDLAARFAALNRGAE